nr:hypothetical protein [Tanacetum cinerariifolium]
MTQAQQRAYMSTYIKNMGSYTFKQLTKLSFGKIKELFETIMKIVNTFIPMETKVRRRASMLVLGSSKAKITDSTEVRSSKRATEAKLDYEGSKRQKTNKEAYQFFDDMLKAFDRDDLVMLWSLVKEGFSSTEPTDDKEKTLWVELKRLFEPDTDDTLWKLQSLDQLGEFFHVSPALVVVESEVLNDFPRFVDILIAEFAAAGTVNLALKMKGDMIIKYLDLKPMIDDMMRDFL